MNKFPWSIAYFTVLAGELTGIIMGDHRLQYIFKPLLMLVLLMYFISAPRPKSASAFIFIIAALGLSWLGDILLLFGSRAEIYFLLGLGAFLLAHVFYILYLHRLRLNQSVSVKPWLMPVIVVYYISLITLLSPGLGDKKIPVYIYGIVISFMFLLAMHLLWANNKPAGRKIFTGALLFVISDSILAIDKFYEPLPSAGVLIMVTYALAQYLIVDGAISFNKQLRGV